MTDLLDDIRQMVGYADPDADDTLIGAQDMFTDDVPTWMLLRESGGTRNDYDELVGTTTTETPLSVINVPITERVREQIGGDWSDVDTMLRMKDATLQRGDILRPEPDDGRRFKVMRLQTPRIGAQVVCVNVMLSRIHT